jgi:hypothetical protein
MTFWNRLQAAEKRVAPYVGCFRPSSMTKRSETENFSQGAGQSLGTACQFGSIGHVPITQNFSFFRCSVAP